jgi:hypothetical protein
MYIKPLSLIVTRRSIQITLGFLWLLDGALQLQKQMFSANFANDVIAPSATGQPLIVSGPIHFEIHILLLHPAIFNLFFALTQLLIGFLILFKRTTRIGLIGSTIWALMVWYLGEGLGGLLGLHTILLIGAPGAVIIYAILALAVMPKNDTKFDRQPAFWLPLIWAILWIGGAIYQILPGQNTAADISSMILNNSTNAPHWLASLDVNLANKINHITHNGAVASMHMSAYQMAHMQTQSTSGSWLIVILVIIQLLIGLLILLRGSFRKTAIIIGIILSLCFWVYGQNLGNYYSGLATDPNSAPLFIILGVAILGCSQLPIKKLFNDSFKKFDKFIT